jgi:hypothetical protein
MTRATARARGAIVTTMATLIALAGLTSLALAQAQWTIDARPIFDASGLTAAGSVNFENPRGATRLSDGGVLVADRGSMSIRVFDRLGHLVRNVGRQGHGPGEFGYIGLAVPCGRDSLLVWEPATTRVIGPTGEIARQMQMPSNAPGPQPSLSISCSTNGSISYLSNPTEWKPGSITDLFILKSTIARVSRDGKLLWHVDSIPSGEWVSTHPGGYPRPLGNTVYSATVGDIVALGRTDSSRVDLYHTDGRRTSIPVPGTSRAPTQQEIDAAVQQVTWIAPANTRAIVGAALARFPAAKTIPSLFGLWADPAGLIWVQTSSPAAKQTEFVVLRPSGDVVARASAKMNLSIFEIGKDYLLGTYTDDADEPHIVVLSLIRR